MLEQRTARSTADLLPDLLVPAAEVEPDPDPDRDLATAQALRDYLAARADS